VQSAGDFLSQLSRAIKGKNQQLIRHMQVKTFLTLLSVTALLWFAPPAVPQQITPPAGLSSAAIDLFNDGIILSNAEKYAEAAEKFRAVCEQAPNFAEAFGMYGFCLLRTGKLAEADTELSKAYAINPKLPMILLNLAGVKQSEGELTAAKSFLLMYLQEAPNGEHATKARAMLETLNHELGRQSTVKSSVGNQNYFEEATSPGIARWDMSQMPIKVFIADSSAVKGYTPLFPKALKEAFADWTLATGGAVSVQFVNAPPVGGVICSFISDSAELRNAMEGGEAVISVDQDGIVHKGTIKILTHNSATGTPEQDALLKAISLHEVGHILGLRAHSSDRHDVMFGFRTSPPTTQLTNRDIATMRKLYAVKSSGG
jgi:predicted Zn-dependent protease